MAGRFPLLTDNHVRQQLVEALTSRGWDVVRAIDVFPERTSDEALFAHAAATGRVFVSTDEPAQEIPKRWLREGRPVPADTRDAASSKVGILPSWSPPALRRQRRPS